MTADRFPRRIQRDALTRTFAAIHRGDTRGLWILPTGAGKTWAFVELVRCLSVPTVVLVHRTELVRQTVRHLNEQAPWLRVGVVQGKSNEWDADVVVAMVPSLTTARLSVIDRDRFGLVVVDECHHGAADRWAFAIEFFRSGYRLGVTATPERLDGQGLAQWFGGEPIVNYTVRQAIEDAVLCRVRQYALTTTLTLDGVASRKGDWQPKALAEAVNTPERNAAIVEAWKAHGENRKTIGFCVDVQHAADLAFAFCEAGESAAYIDGTMSGDDRRDTLERFAVGKLRLLFNCEILTEGYDDSSIACVVMARPTQSKGLYVQCVGRGLRLHAGKPDCLILDCADLSKKHKLVTAFDLVGKSKKTDADGDDLLDAVDEEEQEEAAHQEAVRAFNGPLSWRLESVCPWPTMPTLDGYQFRQDWESAPASEAQTKYLRRFGVEINRDLTKGEASWLIDQAANYEAAYPAPATDKQETCLRVNGLWVEGMTKKEAGRAITELKKGATT